MDAGAPTEGVEAMDVAERHRAHISKWFYECSPEMHAGLAGTYVNDHRFTEKIDRAAAGLAGYMSAAIMAKATR